MANEGNPVPLRRALSTCAFQSLLDQTLHTLSICVPAAGHPAPVPSLYLNFRKILKAMRCDELKKSKISNLFKKYRAPEQDILYRSLISLKKLNRRLPIQYEQQR